MLRASLWHATPGQLMCASVLGPPSDRSGGGGRLRVVVGFFSGALGLGGGEGWGWTRSKVRTAWLVVLGHGQHT